MGNTANKVDIKASNNYSGIFDARKKPNRRLTKIGSTTPKFNKRLEQPPFEAMPLKPKRSTTPQNTTSILCCFQSTQRVGKSISANDVVNKINYPTLITEDFTNFDKVFPNLIS